MKISQIGCCLRKEVRGGDSVAIYLLLLSWLLFLVVGHHRCRATTHSDLLVRAVELEIPYRVVHNASIMNAVGCCGLQLYHFGETVSIPFWTETWKPDSFVDKIECNLRSGLHTLCLLGIALGGAPLTYLQGTLT